MGISKVAQAVCPIQREDHDRLPYCKQGLFIQRLFWTTPLERALSPTTNVAENLGGKVRDG